MKTAYILIFISIFIVSCIPTKYIEIESLQPADPGLPADANSILVLNGSYLPIADTSDNNPLNYINEKERYIIDTIIINRIFNGLFFVFDQSPYPVLNSTQYAELRVDDTTAFLKPYDISYINDLCNRYNTDHVISFEYYSFSLDKYLSNYSEFESEMVLSLNRKLVWRLYEKDNGLKDEHIMNDTLYWNAYGYNQQSAESQLPEYLDVIKESFWYAGYDYARRYSPYWETDTRSYFSLRNKKGIEVSLQEEELRKIFEEGGSLKKYMAAYNLALVNEMESDIESAMEYINLALSLRPSSEYARFYKSKLENKLSVYNKLEKQIKE